MVQQEQNTKKLVEKKLPTVDELRAQTWESIEGIVRVLMKSMFELLLDRAAGEQLGAGPYQRTESRTGYRNGSYKRKLTSRFGTIEDLLIPRLREGTLLQSLFAPYQQRTDDVDKALGMLFLNGVSTHKIRGIAEQLIGRPVSAQTVSTIMQKTDTELEQYRAKPINDAQFEYLFLDGIHDKIREIGLERKVLLCALGLSKEGRAEILSFRLVDSESEANWTEFLVDLKQRGLKGQSLRLITTDGNPGLRSSLKRLFPYKRHQRCIWHKMNNICMKTKKRNRKAIMGGCKDIFNAKSRHEAIKRFNVWAKHWEIEEPSAVKCLRKDLSECLSYYAIPEERWKTVRTTNILERSFREVRRRTRPMGGTFVNPASAERIHYNVFNLLNQNWNNRSAAFTQNS